LTSPYVDGKRKACINLKSKLLALAYVQLSHRTGDRRGKRSQGGIATGHGEDLQPGMLQAIGSAGRAQSHTRPGKSLALGFNY